MYQMNAGRAEAGPEDGEDLRHRAAEGFGIVVTMSEKSRGTLAVQVRKTLTSAAPAPFASTSGSPPG